MSFSKFFNVIIAAEYIILSFVFAWPMEKRKHFWWIAISTFLAALGITFSLNWLDVGSSLANMIIKYLLMNILGYLAIFASFKIPISSAIFIGETAYTIRHMVYLLISFSTFVLGPYLITDRVSYHCVYYFSGVVALLIYSPLIVYFYKKIRSNTDIALPSIQVLIFSIIGIIANIVFNYYSISYANQQEGATKYIFNVINWVICASTLVIMYNFLFSMNLKKEMMITKQMQAEEQEQYKTTKENIDLINIKCHDLRHQIRTLKESGQVVSKEELDSIENAIRIYDTKFKTGNESLDIILQEKSLVCKKNNIVFNCIIDGKILNFIKPTDIYSLFGNLVDNAIESVLKIENPAQRIITIKVKSLDDGAFCYIENPYVGHLKFANGLPVTTKEDNNYHGYGLKSVQEIVRRYDGSMKLNVDNQVFSITILFPMSVHKKENISNK